MEVLMVDVDGVLVHGRPTDGQPLFTYLERDLGVSLQVLQRAFFEPFWKDIVTGKQEIEPVLTEVLGEIAPHVSPETLLQYWFENDSRLDSNLLQDLAGLRSQGIKMFLATNQEHRRAKYLMHNLKLAHHFDGIFYSADLGYRKPDRQFFEIVTDQVGSPVSQIAFIDDTEANVEAAQHFGWNAMRWTKNSELASTISALKSAQSQPIRL